MAKKLAKKRILIYSDKIVEHPIALLLGWLVFLSFPLLSYLRMVIITRDLAFSGSVRILFHVAFSSTRYLTIVYCLLLIAFWIKKYTNKIIPQAQRRVLYFISATALLFFIINSVLLRIEENQYHNYLYANFGTSYETFQMINKLIILVLVITSYIFYQKNRLKLGFLTTSAKSSAKNTDLFFRIITLLTVLLLISNSFFPLINARALTTAAHLSESDLFGSDYKYIAQLATTVPRTATIIHPPQGSTWSFLGNQPMIRYFLFPRVLVSGYLFTDQNFAQGVATAYFPEIYPDLAEKQWPLVNFDQKLIIFNQKNEIRYETIELISESNGVKIYKIDFI